MAGDEADPEGLVGYLKKQALTNPVAFMGLLGRAMGRLLRNPAAPDGRDYHSQPIALFRVPPRVRRRGS